MVPIALRPGGHREFVRCEILRREIALGVYIWLFSVQVRLRERKTAQPGRVMLQTLLPIVCRTVEIEPHVVGQGLCIRHRRLRRHRGTNDEMLDQMRPLRLLRAVTGQAHWRVGENRDVRAAWKIHGYDTNAVAESDGFSGRWFGEGALTAQHTDHRGEQQE